VIGASPAGSASQGEPRAARAVAPASCP
jgi:hypothetical protein